ncbi:hypothetical protein GALMADRAFT_766262 [Galerina marginata CBS 339.88]|uniref:Uncharacterized protein n=1 Tax=Galerina marginata (strain CBS 339.88) TaxID=685588 RepID=A0A067SZL8_GALM3|nr:hypothetical protein GALMADRAFT_766262 [Galerina marginata CBS 339.88]
MAAVAFPVLECCNKLPKTHKPQAQTQGPEPFFFSGAIVFAVNALVTVLRPIHWRCSYCDDIPIVQSVIREGNLNRRSDGLGEALHIYT